MVRKMDGRLERLFFELHSHIRDTDGLHADAALDELCKVLHARLGGRPSDAFDEPLALSDAALARVTDRLGTQSITDSDADVRGRAFQRLLAPAARAGMGQYFTPEPVVRFMVDVLRPAGGELVLDPFCGSAAFLAHARERASSGPPIVRGIEKSRRMARIASTCLPAGTVLRADALLDFDAYDDLGPECADVVLTNPPFGSILDARSIARLAHFELAPAGRSVPLEVLGLERSVQLLRPGGRLGIVLPDGVLTNETLQPVRDWLAENVVLRALVSLPVETFQPFGASIRTCVLFATRRDTARRARQEDAVCVARIRCIGYDAAGRPVPGCDVDETAAELRAFLDGRPPTRAAVPFAHLLARGRWQVDYFAAPARPAAHSRYAGVPLGELVAERRELALPPADAENDFVYLGLQHVERDTGDLVGFERRRGGTVRSRSKTFRAGDVLYGRLRPYLNKVYLPYGPAPEGLCSGEFHVLTPDTERVHPRFLREVLASPSVARFATRCQSGAALPRVKLADLLALRVPLPSRAEQERIVARLTAYDARRRRLKAELAGLPAETAAWMESALAADVNPPDR